MKKIIQIVLSTLFVQALGIANASAQANEDWVAINLAVTDQHIIPAYGELAHSAGRLSEVSASFCSDVNIDSLDELKQVYHSAMDAWQAIQHVQFGPITYFNWNYRLQYWPDEKGSSGRQLSSLIASKDQGIVDSNTFARQSVGVQGLPALERLLFDEDSLSMLQNDSYRCQLVQVIAKNIHEIAVGVHQRWSGDFREALGLESDSSAYESAEDATIDFMKALVETLPKITQQKIMDVQGESFERARLKKAESWRSERSLKNLKINLISLSQMLGNSSEHDLSLGSALLPDDVAEIKVAFSELVSSVQSLPDSMAVVLADKNQYQQLQALQVQLANLDELLEDALKNTDLYLGFNSLDGD